MSPSTDVTNTDLVLVAMALADAGEDFADIEEIAEAAYRLSPQRFGWRTKPYPDLRSVVQAIADLERKQRKGRTVELTLRGSTDRADTIITRRLTSGGRKAALCAGAKVAGREFADLQELLAHFRSSGAEAPEPTRAARRPAQAELGELRRHAAFQSWADNGDLADVDRWQVLDALSCLPDAQPWAVRNQMESLAALAERWHDTEVTEFLQAVSSNLRTADAHN